MRPEEAAPTPREVDWLLTDADWVATCDESMRCIRSGALAVEGDTIVAVGATDRLRRLFRGRREMNLAGCLLLPGLVNTHTHAAMACFRGLGSDLPLREWLFDVIFPAERAAVNPDFVYWGTLLAAVEMLLNGITTFCDGYFFEGAAARAALDAGSRAVLGQGVLDFPSPDCSDPARARERVETFLEAFPTAGGRLRPSLFCHSPYTCGPATLRWVKELCRERGILFQIHLSETAQEVENLTRERGERPVHYLDRLGILDSNTLCAHAVWVDSEEIALLAARGTGISHNAESNMKLGSGVADIPRFLAAGCTVGLGTDGCASNNDLDLFAEMGTVARLHKVFGRDSVVCPAPDVLRMATRGGARTLGLGDDVGSLDVGMKADLAVIDLNQPHLTPLYDPISHIVYAMRGSDVRHVWVGGRLVVESGRVTTVDAEEAMRQAQRLAGKVKGALRTKRDL